MSLPGAYRTVLNRKAAAGAVNAVGRRPASSNERREDLGWVLGGLVILGVFAVGAAFWFSYHP